MCVLWRTRDGRRGESDVELRCASVNNKNTPNIAVFFAAAAQVAHTHSLSHSLTHEHTLTHSRIVIWRWKRIEMGGEVTLSQVQVELEPRMTSSVYGQDSMSQSLICRTMWCLFTARATMHP